MFRPSDHEFGVVELAGERFWSKQGGTDDAREIDGWPGKAANPMVPIWCRVSRYADALTADSNRAATLSDG